jgi:glutaredoxin-dependent peroxiredoxin
MALSIGDRAPDVVLPSHRHEQVSLGELYRRGPTVVLFFPLAFSSTCTEELCTMRDDEEAYAALNAQVVAISVDSAYVLGRYREELGADYLFLSDFNGEATRAFDVLRTAPVGPGHLNASERAAFVVDADGTISYAWVGAHPGLLPPFEELKSALGELSANA